MSDTSFTPGPWRVVDLGSCVSIRGEVPRSKDAGDYYTGIAIVTQRDPHPRYGGGVDRKTTLSNAHLFAASLDLYKVVDSAPDITSLQPDDFYIAYTAWLGKAKAAIDKAKGEAA